MTLARDIYRAFEDIVGPQNISDEPAIQDSYAFQGMGELLSPQGDKFVFRPEAVILPCCTEEVQAIVKACNRHKLMFKAYSTGWGAWGGPGSEGVIQLDMRRMNHIIEINEADMYAVIEPYVIGAQLQAELMKRHLNCQMIVAGSNATAFPLAPLIGDGLSSVSTSMTGRNTLAVEWVSPTGEIVRLGSFGSGAEWFSGDGPGPSLRGLLRGVNCSRGGMGVFTKAATKVFHWPGPTVSPAAGISPFYTTKPLPLIHTYYMYFPSWEKLSEAGIKIGESEIAYMLATIPQFQLAGDMATNNEEGARLLAEILEKTNGKPCLFTMLTARSQKEFEYQDKVLRTILAETEGKCLTMVEDDGVQGAYTWRSIRVAAGTRQVFRFCGGFGYFDPMANWDRLPDIRGGECNNIIRKYVDKGLFLDDGGDGGFSTSIEYGHLGVSALQVFYDPLEEEPRRAIGEMAMATGRVGLEKYKFLGVAILADDHNMYGPLQSNYHVWLRKLKQIFDPNTASDPSYYIKP